MANEYKMRSGGPKGSPLLILYVLKIFVDYK